MQMLFNFIVNQHMFLAFAQEKAAPLVEGLKALPSIPEIGQWGNFIRNHDELTLDKLSDAQHDEIAAVFAPDRKQMWIYDRGIRRRFAPMVEGDPRRLRLAYSLMFTLPGTPVINYGEELGMGDNLSLEERSSARTPIQWSSEPNGGFSTAPPDQLVLPVITEGKYSYKHLNVINQRRDPKSLLNWMERAIRMRMESQPRMRANIIPIADGKSRQAGVFELTGKHMTVRELDEKGVLYATNHFVSPEMEDKDIDPPPQSSPPRYDRFKQLLEPGGSYSRYGKIDPGVMVEILRDRINPYTFKASPLDVYDDDASIGGNGALWQVMFDPERLLLWIAAGEVPVASNPFVCFSLGEMLGFPDAAPCERLVFE